MASARPPRWSKLDNAAKIFPSTSNRVDTKVFRFACRLREQVEPEALQRALDKTMAQFPFYRCILKKGLFWYYFEDSLRPALVGPEALPLCAPLYNANRKGLLFRVFYHGERISLEVYHALSDGTGALHFLRTLVHYYLLEAHGEEFGDSPPALDYDASQSQKSDDSFSKYFHRGKHAQKSDAPKAYHLWGDRLPDDRLGLIEGRMPVRALLDLAHRYHATLTEFLMAVLIQAIHQGMPLRDQGRPVVLTVPVNLRNYFPSDSARNFFGVVNVGYDFSRQEDSLEAIIAHIREVFARSLTADQLGERMNRLSALEHTLAMKLIPLPCKDPILRIANRLNEREITAAFSNVGRITMPPELAPYIRYFTICASTRRLQACMCSFQGDFVISFTSHFVSTDVQRRFFRAITALGVEVEITSNLEQAAQ